jgi:ribonuclease PH
MRVGEYHRCMLERRPMPRIDARADDAPRTVTITPGFHTMSEGSVLYRCGKTVILCTASVDEKVPAFLEGKGKGWLTAEYQMHPRSNPMRREGRDGRGKAPGGRTQEIQRLVGRALRTAVDLDQLGERTIAIDCDVLEADGGTRTASITGSFVALALALNKLRQKGTLSKRVLREPVSAISVGYSEKGELLLDLCYAEDSKARVDLNLVATEKGCIVEVQGTAEGAAVPRATIDAMVTLALQGTQSLCALQRKTLAEAGVSLDSLLIEG